MRAFALTVIHPFAAYKHESTAYNLTLEYFSIKDDSTAWIMPVLVRVSNDLRTVATMVMLHIIRLNVTMLAVIVFSFPCRPMRQLVISIISA